MSFDLKADQKVAYAPEGLDEMDNAVPLTGSGVFAVTDPAILSLVDNGDNTCTVAAVGTPGSAMLTFAVSQDGKDFIGSEAINVVVGDLTTVRMVPGTPEEVTPDV